MNEIIEKLYERGFSAGRRIVKKLLLKNNYKKRKIQRRRTIKAVENRNEQFEKIAGLKQEYMLQTDNPIVSIDAKKRELIGDLYRAGEVYSKEEIASYDHDFPHLSTGVAIPHGIFDLKKNKAHINKCTSHETRIASELTSGS